MPKNHNLTYEWMKQALKWWFGTFRDSVRTRRLIGVQFLNLIHDRVHNWGEWVEANNCYSINQWMVAEQLCKECSTPQRQNWSDLKEKDP